MKKIIDDLKEDDFVSYGHWARNEPVGFFLVLMMVVTVIIFIVFLVISAIQYPI